VPVLHKGAVILAVFCGVFKHETLLMNGVRPLPSGELAEVDGETLLAVVGRQRS
jgi:hypothetical protein